MKKLFVLLGILLFLTGCSIKEISNNNVDEIIDSVIVKNTKLKNVNFDGYSYYIPRGLSFVNKNDYNAVLRDNKNNNYYFYIDAVSYYHKVVKSYKVDNDAFYSREIKNGKKFGYFEINQKNGYYFIEAMYNYMKVEGYVEEDDLYDAVTNISLVLSSIKYNDKVLSTTIGENVLSYKEENYNIFETKKNESDFLNYVKEYDDYVEEEIDEDNLKVEEGE